MTHSILIYTESTSPRVEYIFNHILGGILGLKVNFTQVDHEARAYQGVVISYSKIPVANSIHVFPHTILFEHDVREHNIDVSHWNGLPTLFHGSGTGEIPFDIFAASFFLITRYEEYLPFTPDEHGRFQAIGSVASQNGFLELPLVDLWARGLGDTICQRFLGVSIRRRGFMCVPTIDIDNAYAFRHKGVPRAVASTLGSLVGMRFRELKHRIQVYCNIRPDPFDTYSSIFRIIRGYPQSIFFILGGRYGTFDKHIPLNNKAMRCMVRDISQRFSVGVHPSYGSWLSKGRVGEEVELLSQVAGKPIERSRQHFLRFTLPQSYRILSELGIRSDYSMGYPDRVGFRASTCTPFPFFDLFDNRMLPLTVHPFQVMDVTLRHHMGLGPSEAVEKSLSIARNIMDLGGTFILIWHNESLSGIGAWEGWEDVLERVLEGIPALK